MSYRAMEAAFQTAAPTLAAKMVMLCLAHHHNGLTGQCNPSQALIAKETGLTNVARAVKELVDAGLIKKRATKKRGENPHKSSNHYTLMFLPEVQAAEAAAGRMVSVGGAISGKPKQESPPSPLRYEGGKPPPKKKRSQRAKPKTLIVADWRPSEKLMEEARAKGLTDDVIDGMVFKFVNYWTGVGKPMADWSAVWRNWIIREQEWKRNEQERDARLGRRANEPEHRRATHDDAAMAALRFVRGEDAGEP